MRPRTSHRRSGHRFRRDLRRTFPPGGRRFERPFVVQPLRTIFLPGVSQLLLDAGARRREARPDTAQRVARPNDIRSGCPPLSEDLWPTIHRAPSGFLFSLFDAFSNRIRSLDDYYVVCLDVVLPESRLACTNDHLVAAQGIRSSFDWRFRGSGRTFAPRARSFLASLNVAVDSSRIRTGGTYPSSANQRIEHEQRLRMRRASSRLYAAFDVRTTTRRDESR